MGDAVQSPPTRGRLWYFRTMKMQRPPPAFPDTNALSGPTAKSDGASLASLHRDALYRPVPPVELDGDGYLHTDSAVSESTIHDKLRAYASGSLRARYAARHEVLVASNLCVFFERGNRRAVVVPDMFVAFGAGAADRWSYKVWEEGQVPDFALELLSEETWRRDIEAKPGLYEALGVREFWIFDPLGRLPQPIVGRRLDPAGAYRRVRRTDGGYRSGVLGLDLIEGGDGFRFRDPATGEILPDLGEAIAQRDREASARRAAEARVAELEQQLQRSRGRDVGEGTG